MQVWVKPELKEDGKLYWRADSDSQLTKVCGLGCWHWLMPPARSVLLCQ